MNRKTLCSLLALFVFTLFTGYERRTEAKIEGGNPPTFLLSGSGRLGEFVVFGPEQEKITDPFDDTFVIWRIKAEESGEAGAMLVEEIGSITYGIPPPKYKQITPANNSPSELSPGLRYKYYFVSVNAPWATGYFEIRDRKAVSVMGP